MKTETAAYGVERAKRQTVPVYEARFFHVKTYGDATDYEYAVRFATSANIIAPGKPILPYLMRVKGNTQTVEAELGRSEIGGFVMSLLDKGGEVLKYLSNPALTLNGAHTSGVATITVNENTAGYPAIGTVEITTAGVLERVRYAGKTTFTFTGCTRGVDGTSAAAHNNADPVANGEEIRPGTRMQLYAGYAPLLESDYMSFCKMEVIDRGIAADKVTFQIAVADMQRTLRRTIFLAASATAPVILAGNPIDIGLAVLTSKGTFTALAGTLSKTVGSTAVTGVGTDWNVSLAVGNIIRAADGELLRVAGGIAAGTFTAAQNAILTASGVTARKGGTNGTYDVLDAVDALATPSAFVDTATWEALRTSDFSANQYQFSLVDRESGKTWLEEQIHKTLNTYPVVNQTGQLSIKRYKVTVTAPTVTLDEDTIIGDTPFQWGRADRQILNVIQVNYDWNIPGAAGIYGALQVYEKTNGGSGVPLSVEKYGRKSPLIISAKGWRTSLGAQTMADDRALEVTRRFAEPGMILPVECFYSRHLLDMGDQIKVTDSRIPNQRTGLRGLTSEVFEILDLAPSFGAEGRVKMTLLWVGAIAAQTAPTSGGEVSTSSPLVGFENLSLDEGIKLAGMATRFAVTTAGGSPRSAFRRLDDGTLQLQFAIATGDQLEYAIWVHSESLDTRVGVDMAVVTRPLGELVGTGGNDATHVKLNAAASAVDDFYNGQIIQLFVGANPSQFRHVDDYVGASRIATTSPAWTNNPVDATSTYNLFDVLRNPNRAVVDQNGVSIAPSTQLGAPAQGRWYTRRCTLPAIWNGLDVLQFALGMDQLGGNTLAYLTELRLLTSTGVLRYNLLRYTYTGLNVVWFAGTGPTVDADQNITAAQHGAISAAPPGDGTG